MMKSHHIPSLCHEHSHGVKTNTWKNHGKKTNTWKNHGEKTNAWKNHGEKTNTWKNHGEKTNTLKAQQSFCSGVLAATRSFAMMNSLNQASE